ncbi:MAG TPA: pirin family protein [Acidimicrobiales bacterium]|nr:pirin family protein [Acidimicrobiales bacterium]
MSTRRIDRAHGVTVTGGDSQVDRKALVIPPGYWDLFDPFLMLAEDWFSTPGFDWHPHRGIETVTIVVDGALEHGDNRGNAGVLGPGDVQWMTAGGGIVHRELAHRDERVHSLQLWVNLPSMHKMVEARYQDLSADKLTTVDGLTVVSGRLGDVTGPAENHWPITGLQVALEPGTTRTLDLPPADRAFLYVMSGVVHVGDEVLRGGEVGWSDPADGPLVLNAPEGDELVRIVAFSGRPIGEPVVARGPFVMNTAAEIEYAYRDYMAGRFGPVPELARLP